MKIEIGAMVNGAFIKKGSIVKMRNNRAENRDGFYATVIDIDENRIDFVYEDDNGEKWDEYEYWSDLDFVELVQ